MCDSLQLDRTTSCWVQAGCSLNIGNVWNAFISTMQWIPSMTLKMVVCMMRWTSISISMNRCSSYWKKVVAIARVIEVIVWKIHIIHITYWLLETNVYSCFFHWSIHYVFWKRVWIHFLYLLYWSKIYKMYVPQSHTASEYFIRYISLGECISIQWIFYTIYFIGRMY